jgi:hypothetical protein
LSAATWLAIRLIGRARPLGIDSLTDGSVALSWKKGDPRRSAGFPGTDNLTRGGFIGTLLSPRRDLRVSGMSKVDEFRRHAALCQRMADESIRVSDKIQWLSLAQDWLALVRASESGYIDVAPLTGQQESTSSHLTEA